MRCWLLTTVFALLPAVAMAAEKLYDGATLEQWRTRLADFDATSPRGAAAVPALTEIFADSTVDPVTRRAAALALGRVGRPARSALPLLIQILDTPERDATGEPAWAAKAISLLGPQGREATPALAAAVMDTKRDFALRQLSLEALARIGGAHPAAVPAIISVVQLSPVDEAQNEQQAELRQLAVEALGVAGADAAVAAPLLARILRSPDEREVLRRRSAESLAAMGPAARFAFESLTETLIIDESEAVRDAAAIALGAMGESARPQLAQMLKHEDIGVRWRAAQALGEMGEATEPSLTALQQISSNDGEAEIVRLHAATSLWKLEANAARVWPTALKLLQSDDRNLRMQSLDLLVALGPQAKAAEPQLRLLTHHARREVRQIAEQALRKLAEPPQ